MIRAGQTAPVCHDWPVATIAELNAAELAALGPPWTTPGKLRDYTLAGLDGLSALAQWQDGRCAICGDRLGRQVLDHDHRTALVRGYLCDSCNLREAAGVGPLWDAYRARPPAVILGVVEVYCSPVFGMAVPFDDDRDRWRDNVAGKVGL